MVTIKEFKYPQYDIVARQLFKKNYSDLDRVDQLQIKGIVKKSKTTIAHQHEMNRELVWNRRRSRWENRLMPSFVDKKIKEWKLKNR